MTLSIVIALDRECPALPAFCERASTAAARLSHEFEIVLVSDGFEGPAANAARTLASEIPHVRFIALSRVFGDARAILTGLEYTCGDLVFLVDPTRDDPALLEDFAHVLFATEADVVYGLRRYDESRTGKRVMAQLLRHLSGSAIPDEAANTRLMTRRYVGAATAHRDSEPHLPTIWRSAGFKQVPFALPGDTEPGGAVERGLLRALLEGVEAVTTFSTRPLVYVFYLGLCILFVAISAAALLVVRTVFLGPLLSGWPSLIVSIWLMGGMIVFALGVLSIYLSRIFMETKDRPYTVIRGVYRNEHAHHR